MPRKITPSVDKKISSRKRVKKTTGETALLEDAGETPATQEDMGETPMGLTGKTSARREGETPSPQDATPATQELAAATQDQTSAPQVETLLFDADFGRLVQDVPTDRAGLARFIRRHFGLSVPDRAVCPNHQSPMDYLAASFLEQRDLLVWANRGGGKTFLAAIATLMDALCHGPLKVNVLGGSFDQSDRLAEYIREALASQPDMIAGRGTRTKVRTVTGSVIQMLAQSQTAVRGQHVQKIRCDEVDLFDAEVWRAVQFATRSVKGTRGSIEVISTLHRSGGLMQTLVDQARAGQLIGSGGYRLIQWCLWEVIERCPPTRQCHGCPLAEDCRGVARDACGFFAIDDAIAIKARSSRAAWEAEMLCLGVRRDWLVFPEFDPMRHTANVNYTGDRPLYRAIDFGYRNPMVCLWLQVMADGTVHVLDEYVASRRALPEHAQEILARDMAPAAATYVDPAGRQKEATSGAACTDMLAAAGIPCTCRGSTIAEGLELVRAWLSPAGGGTRLLIHPRCRQVIESFNNYHYPPPDAIGERDKPVKDGPDHAIDALRYFFINRMHPNVAVARGMY